MKFLTKITNIILAIALLINSNLPVSAISDNGGTGLSPVNLAVETTNFDIIIPINLPISVAADGTVTVANDAKIVNNSYGPVVINNIKLTTNSD
jgi:murein DD-endopeptidase MepM/ murein hydrolase activator NlpD